MRSKCGAINTLEKKTTHENPKPKNADSKALALPGLQNQQPPGVGAKFCTLRASPRVDHGCVRSSLKCGCIHASLFLCYPFWQINVESSLAVRGVAVRQHERVGPFVRRHRTITAQGLQRCACTAVCAASYVPSRPPARPPLLYIGWFGVG